MSQATRFSLTNCASTCLKHGKIRFFLPIYKMPTKLILLTETLMELAQGFHKQNLIDQRDIERWDLKPSQHDPTCIVYILFSSFDLVLIWYGMTWQCVWDIVGQRGDLLSQFFLLCQSSWVNGRMATWMECHTSEELSVKKRWVSHVASHPFSLTNCASTCLKHDKIRFYQFIKCQQN